MPVVTSKAPVTRAELRQELEGWATEIKGNLNGIEEKLEPLSEMAKTLKGLLQNSQ